MKRSWFGIPIFFALLVGLASCGGGGGSSTSTPPETVNPEGIWRGTFTENGVGTFEVDGLIYDGEIIAYSEDAGVMYRGTINVSGSNLTASANCYEVGGGLTGTSSISGTMSAQNSLQATFTTTYLSNNATTTGTIALNYDSVYDRTSSISSIQGNWGVVNGSYTFSSTIDSQGSITGNDSDGCVYTGVFSILDPQKNLYTADIDVAQCGVMNGTYGGYAILYDENAENDGLTWWVSNATYMVTGSLLKN